MKRTHHNLGSIEEGKFSKKLNEKNFLKNAFNTAKSFLKTKYSNVKKYAKKILTAIKRDTGTVKTKKTLFTPGNMVAMQYKAKDITKKYDAAPLIICLGPSRNPKLSNSHFFGINLHWIDLQQRVALAHLFLKAKDENKGKLTYDLTKAILQKYKDSPMLRMYIYDNVSSKIYDMSIPLKINNSEKESATETFLLAASLPSERWMGGK